MPPLPPPHERAEGADRAVARLRSAYAMERLVGTTPAFARVLRTLPTLGARDATVLIVGETGTGKELVARAIHYLGTRAGGPFVAVNCGSLPDTLLEDELFGHERGAFTDARARRRGMLAQAQGGTLFLDEVDALSMRGQVSLLRVLQDRTFRMLGASSESQVDVRFIAATNTDLAARVREGRFRADLYYRLHVLSATIPPLRDRPGDILPLARHFLQKHATVGEEALTLTADAERALLAHPWPGNVRELENAILRALCHRDGRQLRAPDLALAAGWEAALADAPPAGGAPVPAPCPPDATEEPLRAFNEMKRELVLAFERNYLTRLMVVHRGNVTRAARVAGKERRELGKLLKKHRLDPRRFASRG
ncbi:MAG TPA: sigma 54-interacting transcriptional regulator [Gemmatimonadaceae bacterium]